MAIAHVVSTAQGASGAGNFTTSAINTTGANLIVVALCVYHPGTGLALSDSASNTWTGLTQQGTGDTRVRLFYCFNPTISATHTFTASGSNIYATVGVSAFSGAKAFDQESAGFASATNDVTAQPGSLTPPVDHCLLVTGLSIIPGTSITVNSSFNASVVNYLASNHAGGGIAYKIQTTAGAENPTWSWTTAGDRASAMASFSPKGVGHRVIGGGCGRVIGGG